jgi:serine/threonine protein kinase
MATGVYPWFEATYLSSAYTKWYINPSPNISPWNKMDRPLFSLLQKILKTKPDERSTLRQIRQDVWFSESYASTVRIPHPPSSVDDENIARIVCLCSIYESRPPPPLPPLQQLVPVPRVFAHVSEAQACEGHLSTARITSRKFPNDIYKFHKCENCTTRFFVTVSAREISNRLIRVFKSSGWSWVVNNESFMTVSSLEQRNVTFKTTLHNIHGQILVDFSMSTGNFFEFKRNIDKIKESKDIAEILSTRPVGNILMH